MTLGTGIVFSGFVYACTCRLSDGVNDTGIERGRDVAWICLAVGISVDLLATF